MELPDLQTVLTVIIVLITINLIFVGFYIIKVLRDVSQVVKKASIVIDDVDKTVKDGIDKVKAMEKPLQAVATTTAAITSAVGAVRNSNIFGKATRSILGDMGAGVSSKVDEAVRLKENHYRDNDNNLKDEVSSLLDDTLDASEEGADRELEKKRFITPKFFRK